MSKYLYLIDPGHGGLNPDTEEYVTSGKRSPKKDDGSVFYEGVNNRDNAKRIVSALKKAGFDSELLIDTWEDVPLSKRCSIANSKNKERKVVVISIHSDAFGNGKEWTSPSGISVYTSPGKTKSDKFAELVIQELVCYINTKVKWRFDNTDGDRDKEAHFKILTGTNCPAILIEAGFHTNKKEVEMIETEEYKTLLVSSIVSAVDIYEHINS